MILGKMTQISNDDSISGQRQGDPAVDRPASHAAVLQRIIAKSQRVPVSTQSVEDKAVIQQQSLERVIGTALARTAERLYAMPIFVQDIAVAPSTLAELPELLPEQALLAVVEGRGAAIGVVALSPVFVASVIEMQAIGRVSGREVRPRKPTRTDASISADFVNMLLSELGKDLASNMALPVFSTFSYASFLDDSRPLMLMLEDVALTRITLNFRIGAGGKRDGSIIIALPASRVPDPKQRPADRGLLSAMATTQAGPNPADPVREITVSQGSAVAAGDSLALAIQNAPIQLVGILCRKKVSLGTLRNLAPGAMIPLPPTALDDARIETLQGQVLAQGRLGEADGYHAIRLRAPAAQQYTGRPVRSQGPERATAEQTEAVFPDVDVSQPDAFRPDASDHIDADTRPASATDGTAAYDIRLPQPESR